MVPYTTDSLAPADPRFLPRVPGVREIDHLFAVPASVGRGTLSVEGGVSVVGGPGMGKTSLLNHLARDLNERRGFATTIVHGPPIDQYRDEAGFYPYLGAVLREIEAGLRGTDVPSPPATTGDAVEEITPRTFDERIRAIGAQASHATGLCLLFDDIDAITQAAWKDAFVAALRFTFQSCPGITPVYGVWLLFRDESLAGSNYFRNVTHPVFLAPLPASSESTDGGSRAALVRAGLPGVSDQDLDRVSALVGGHPQLLHRLCADVLASGWTAGNGAAIDSGLDQSACDGERALVRALLAASPGLAEALRALAARSPTGTGGPVVLYRSLPKGLVASGLVDEAADGTARVPLRVAECL